MAGKPSGMAATAKDMAIINISSKSLPWSIPMPNTIIHTIIQERPKYLPN